MNAQHPTRRISPSYLRSNKRRMVMHICADISRDRSKFSYQDVYNKQAQPVYWSIYERHLLPRQVYQIMSIAPYLQPVGTWQRSTEYAFIEDFRPLATPPEMAWRFAPKSQTVNEVAQR